MEGETLPRFDSKSRMFGNVKYPREHRMPGYAQKAAFFYLEIVTRCASLQYYTVLVYVSVLVGVVHLRLFPIFKAHFHCQAHLLDTIYCVHVSHCTYIQCAPVPVRSAHCPCGRVCACVCARGLLASVVRAYIVDSPAVLPRAGLAVNFFEIVFGQSISVRLSSAGMGDAS